MSVLSLSEVPAKLRKLSREICVPERLNEIADVIELAVLEHDRIRELASNLGIDNTDLRASIADLERDKERLAEQLRSFGEVIDDLASGHRELILQKAELAERVKVLEAALMIYADKRNWECARCGNHDDVNCFLSRWARPLGDSHDAQPWDTARAALSSTGSATPKEEGS